MAASARFSRRSANTARKSTTNCRSPGGQRDARGRDAPRFEIAPQPARRRAGDGSPAAPTWPGRARRAKRRRRSRRATAGAAAARRRWRRDRRAHGRTWSRAATSPTTRVAARRSLVRPESFSAPSIPYNVYRRAGSRPHGKPSTFDELRVDDREGRFVTGSPFDGLRVTTVLRRGSGTTSSYLILAYLFALFPFFKRRPLRSTSLRRNVSDRAWTPPCSPAQRSDLSSLFLSPSRL